MKLLICYMVIFFGLVFGLNGQTLAPFEAKQKAPLPASDQKIVFAKPIAQTLIPGIPLADAALFDLAYTKIKERVEAEGLRIAETADSLMAAAYEKAANVHITMVAWEANPVLKAKVQQNGFGATELKLLSEQAKQVAEREQADQVVFLFENRNIAYSILPANGIITLYAYLLAFDKQGKIIGQSQYSLPDGKAIRADDYDQLLDSYRKMATYPKYLIKNFFQKETLNQGADLPTMLSSKYKVWSEKDTKYLEASSKALEDTQVPIMWNPGEWVVYRSLNNGKFDGIIAIGNAGIYSDVPVIEFQFSFGSFAACYRLFFLHNSESQQSGDLFKATLLGGQTWMNKAAKTVAPNVAANILNSCRTYLWLINPAVSKHGLVAGDIAVPAGIFDSVKFDSMAFAGLMSLPSEGTVYRNSQIPFAHVAKSISKDSKVILELLDFGKDGYIPLFN